MANKKNPQEKQFDRLIKQTVIRYQQNIDKWRLALNSAENVIVPNRIALYTLYRELVFDNTYVSCINNIKERMSSLKFKLVDSKGKENKAVTKLYSQSWYNELLNHFIDSLYWGHSLIKIEGVNENGILSLCLFPREYVIPETYSIKQAPYSYVEWLNYKDWLKNGYWCEIMNNNSRRDLGLLNSLASVILSKKEALQNWVEYLTTVGYPILLLKTPQNSVEQDERFLEFLSNVNKNSAAIINDKDTVEAIQVANSDCFQTFKELMLFCANEIMMMTLGGSEIISGGTGGSEARATIHDKQSDYKLDSLANKWKTFLNETWNENLKKAGIINTSDVTFEYQIDTDLDALGDLYNKVKTLTDSEFDPKWLAEVFGVKFLKEVETPEEQNTDKNEI